MKSHDLALEPSRTSKGVFYGWFILATTTMTSLLVWGFYYSLGVFFEDLQRTFNANRADVSLVSSICIFTVYIMSMAYGWATDRFSPRIVLGIGGVFSFFGLLFASRAAELWQLYITLGFMVGLGTGATLVPHVSLLSRWFVKRRGLAIGIMAAGSGAGMTIISPLSQALLTTIGWRTTFLFLSFATLILFGLSAFVVRGWPKEKGLLPYGVTDSQAKEVAAGKKTVGTDDNSITLEQAMRGKDLWLVLGMRIFLSLAIFMVNLHLVNYAVDAGLSRAAAAMLMSIVGAVSIFGKIGAGHLVDLIGSKKIVIACAAGLAAVMFWLSGPMGGQMMQISAAIYGIAYGGSYALFNTIVADTFGVAQMGKILGVVNIGSAVGSLIGPWLAGFIFDATGSYTVAFLAAAAASLVAVVLTFPLGKRAK